MALLILPCAKPLASADFVSFDLPVLSSWTQHNVFKVHPSNSIYISTSFLLTAKHSTVWIFLYPFICFSLCLFIWDTEVLKKKERERERKKLALIHWVTPQLPAKGKAGPEPKLGARNTIQVPHKAGWEGRNSNIWAISAACISSKQEHEVRGRSQDSKWHTGIFTTKQNAISHPFLDGHVHGLLLPSGNDYLNYPPKT